MKDLDETENPNETKTKNDQPSVPTSILFVDDEVITCRHFVRMFQNQFTIFVANETVHARNLLEKNQSQIGVVISDHYMPGDSGISFLVEVKKSYPDVIRILTTSNALPDISSSACQMAEVFALIEKPWDVDQLQRTLREAVDWYKQMKTL